MTQEQTALHERFLKGITLKMLGYGAFGLITVVSSFWVGFTALKESIRDNQIQCNERITSAINYANKREDSLQHINDLSFKDVWNAIDVKPEKVIYKYPSHEQKGFVTESYPNGHNNKPVLTPVN